MTLSRCFFRGMAFLIALSIGSTAFAQFDELSRNIPSSANAVAFVDVAKLMSSPVAIRDKWKDNRDNAFASGLSILPPDASQAIMAMQVDLQSWLPLWQLAVLELDHEPSPPKVAAMTGGDIDNVQGRAAVALPEDAYVVVLEKRTAGFMAPANRQSVARWLREVDSRKGAALSPYLTEARRFVSELGTPVILALDLEDAVTVEDIKGRLEGAKELLAKHQVSIDQVAKDLSGIRGVTLGITFGEKPYGKIKVDFRDNVSWTPLFAKSALLHALGNHGAMIDEFEEWKPAVDGKQISLEGYFTASGIRRISSLFDRPPSLKERGAPNQQANSQKTTEEITRDASVAYFHRINELIDDLKGEKKGNKSYTMAQIGVWMDKYAKKIDQLSVLNVDPELVEFSAAAADTLRAAYNSIRQGAARSRVRQVDTAMPYNYYSGTVDYGWTYRDATVGVADRRAYWHNRTAVQTEERVASASSARDLMQSLERGTADIRRKMTQKYQVDF